MNPKATTVNTKQVWQGSRSFDHLIIVFCGILALLVGFVLSYDISLTDLHKNFQATGQIVGTLEWTQEKVLFRPGDILAWDGAAANQELRSRDLIYTEAKASAKVALKSLSDIELGEKTLLALETIDGEPLIKVLSGSVKVKNDSKSRIHIKVRNHRAIAIAGGTTVAMRRSESGELGLNVLKGQVQHGNALVIQGQKAKFDQTGELTEVKAVSVKNDSPNHSKAVPPLKSSPPSPEPQAPAGPLEPPKIPPKLKIEKSQSSRTKPFLRTRRNPLATVILTSLWEAPLWAREEEGKNIGGRSRVQWPAVAGAKAYQVEVSRKMDFQNLIWQGTVVNPEVDLKALGVGVYYLRVATVNQAGQRGPFSSPSLLEIMAKKLLPPQNGAIELVGPNDGKSLETEGEGEYVSLVWKPAVGTKCQQYTIELVAKREGGVQQVQRLTANFHHWKVFLKPGRYLWRVRSEPDLKGGDCPNWSKTRSIGIKKKPQNIQISSQTPSQTPLPTPKEKSREPVVEVPYEPFMTMITLMAPGTFHYQSQKLEPEVSLEALFFNHFGVGIATPLGQDNQVGWGGFLTVKRLSAVLFNKQTEAVMEVQPEIPVQLYESELGLRWENQAGIKPPLAFGMSLGIGLVAKDHGLLIWNDADSLSLSKVLTYFPMVEGKVSMGVTNRSQLFCGISYGSSGNPIGSKNSLEARDISGGWSTRMAREALVSEFSLGVTLNNSQGTLNTKHARPTPYSFKTTRKLVVMTLAREI